MNEQAGSLTWSFIQLLKINKYLPLCPVLYSLSQENAAVMRVIPPILSINTSACAATGVETKGKSCLLYRLISKSSLVLKWPYGWFHSPYSLLPTALVVILTLHKVKVNCSLWWISYLEQVSHLCKLISRVLKWMETNWNQWKENQFYNVLYAFKNGHQ